VRRLLVREHWPPFLHEPRPATFEGTAAYVVAGYENHQQTRARQQADQKYDAQILGKRLLVAGIIIPLTRGSCRTRGNLSRLEIMRINA
jgi:hypothetical protein